MRSRAVPVGLFAAGVVLVLGASCSTTPSQDTPSGALRLFLEAMDRSASDATALEEAYRMLDGHARSQLAERARMASALGGGRDFEPWEMLAPGRFRLRFAPARRAPMRERITGNKAIVTVTGAEPGQHAEVPMSREGAHWRVALELPPPREPSAAPAQAPAPAPPAR